MPRNIKYMQYCRMASVVELTHGKMANFEERGLFSQILVSRLWTISRNWVAPDFVKRLFSLTFLKLQFRINPPKSTNFTRCTSLKSVVDTAVVHWTCEGGHIFIWRRNEYYYSWRRTEYWQASGCITPSFTPKNVTTFTSWRHSKRKKAVAATDTNRVTHMRWADTGNDFCQWLEMRQPRLKPMKPHDAHLKQDRRRGNCSFEAQNSKPSKPAL